MNSERLWDVAVVGAGAAGLMCAIHCRESGLDTLLLDGREKIGAKILMSGGTRCNVTNREVTEKDFCSDTGGRTIRNILRAYPASKSVEFFESMGVELELNEEGKYFPKTQSAQTVLDALLQRVRESGVELKTSSKVASVARDASGYTVTGNGFSYRAKQLVLCTGGLSFPTTGSDGSGYALAQSLGHTLVFTSPSLTPLKTADADWKSLSGIALPVRLECWRDHRALAQSEGAFLFTHTGFSGPSALDISRYWIRAEQSPDRQIMADFLPAENEEVTRGWLMNAQKTRPKVLIKTLLGEKLPNRFCEVLMKKLGISPDRVLSYLDAASREKLIKALHHWPLPVSGFWGYEKAEVTAGGVSLEEVDSKSLESRCSPGLFLAGEILDVDGRIGGFNFQWAWSSAWCVSQVISQKKKVAQN